MANDKMYSNSVLAISSKSVHLSNNGYHWKTGVDEDNFSGKQ